MAYITLFVDVILPLALPRLYTYRVPVELNDRMVVGQRVAVQFGKSKVYSALVHAVHQKAPQVYEAKYILAVIDEEPIVNQYQLELWQWIASYYMCTLGEVMTAALPAALKLQSETKIILNPHYEGSYETLTDKEYLIAEALELKNELSLTEISQIIGQKTVFPIMKSLINKGVVLVEEEMEERFKPKIKTFVALTDKGRDDNWMGHVFAQLEKKSPKQLELLMSFFNITAQAGTGKGVMKAELLKSVDGSAAMLNSLVKKGVFSLYEEEVSRFGEAEMEVEDKVELNEVQTVALAEIKTSFEEKEVSLLHGVTSSGKTEIYIHLIEEAVSKGKQVLYLLPEIALTAQIINRLRKHFGNKVAVYHSRFSDNERVEVWRKLLNNDVNAPLTDNSLQIVIGARSAMFLPFNNLGLIIVDEEHEASFKQYDPAPRYNARDSAIFLAYLHNAKTLLGSATPSVESYYNAEQGKYGLVNLSKRHGGMQLPEIWVADVKEETRKKMIKSHFTSVLLEQMQMALDNKEQIILFQNRRGYAPMLECQTCAWTPHCIHCDVSLTYHKQKDELRCHYCGFNQKPPKACSACGSVNVQMKGFGTEKIEDELAIFFPKAKVLRMDQDTTRSKNAYSNIITAFEERQVDILVGTQMVTKGLDFDNVSTVGIMNADNMLNFPDFRAFERSFQLMAQVSGRSGRKQKRGKVIIQTHNPNHAAIQYVMENNYLAMYANELLERRNFKYPPFYRLIEITLKHKDYDTHTRAAIELANGLKIALGNRVLGPESPGIARIKNYFIKCILIKVERELSIKEAKSRIAEAINNFKSLADYKATVVQVNVDPM